MDNASECFFHFGAYSNDNILVTGTRTSLCKIVESRTQWCVLDSEARAVSEKSFAFLTEEEGKQLFDNNEADVRTDLLYHRKCYQKLMNERLIEQAAKKVSNLSDNHPIQLQPLRKSRRNSADNEKRYFVCRQSAEGYRNTATSLNNLQKGRIILH